MISMGVLVIVAALTAALFLVLYVTRRRRLAYLKSFRATEDPIAAVLFCIEHVGTVLAVREDDGRWRFKHQRTGVSTTGDTPWEAAEALITAVVRGDTAAG